MLDFVAWLCIGDNSLLGFNIKISVTFRLYRIWLWEYSKDHPSLQQIQVFRNFQLSYPSLFPSNSSWSAGTMCVPINFVARIASHAVMKLVHHESDPGDAS